MKKIAAIILVLLLTAGSALAALPAWNTLEYWIGVDVSNQRVTIYKTSDNSVVHCWKCSSGKSSTSTPTGVFYMESPRRSDERQEWYRFSDCWGKYASRITGHILFHSILYKSNSDASIKLDTVEKLGTAASHGCVRLLPDNARWIANHCPPGTKVVIYRGSNDSRILTALGTAPANQLTEELPPVVEVTEVKVSCDSQVTLNVGDTLELNASIEPKDATYPALKYTSSVSTCASVTQSGTVKALKEGKTTITVSSSGKAKAVISVTVQDPYKADSVKITGETLTVVKGETISFGTVVKPDTAKTMLSWSSSKPAIATVDEEGTVTGVKEGKAVITVKTSNGKLDKVTVNVIDPYKASAVRLTCEGTAMVNIGETLTLNAALQPETAKSDLTWTSSNKKLATVKDGVVTGIKAGTVTITVKTDNGKKATLKVQVVDPAKAVKVSVAEGSTITLEAGSKLALTAVMTPDTALDKLTWKTSSRSIATVDANGVVTAVKKGKATITVKTSGGVSCKVTVNVINAAPKPTVTPEPEETVSPEPTGAPDSVETPTPEPEKTEAPSDTGEE